MLRILDRYIFREIASTWLAVTLILLTILLTNQFARACSISAVISSFPSWRPES